MKGANLYIPPMTSQNVQDECGTLLNAICNRQNYQQTLMSATGDFSALFTGKDQHLMGIPYHSYAAIAE